MQQVPGALTTRIQQFEYEADCSHPSSAKVTHVFSYTPSFNPLKAKLNPICHVLALLAHPFSTLAG